MQRASAILRCADAPLLLAWALVGAATALNIGLYTTTSVVLVTGATGILVIGALFALRSVGGPSRHVGAAFAIGSTVFAATQYPAGIYGSGPALTVSHALTTWTAFVVAAWLIFRLPRPRITAYGVILAMVGAGIAMVIASPKPAIDVWYMLQAATHGLSNGHNMYTLRWDGGGGAGWVTNEFTYLPGSAVVLWPFHVLFGDVRYGLLAAMAVTALLLIRLARDEKVALLGIFVVLYPMAMFGLEQSWIDPLTVLGLSAMAYCVISGKPGWAVVAFSFCLVTKQYNWLLVPLACIWPAFGWRRSGAAVLGAAAFLAPWIIAAPHAFYEGAIAENLFLPARINSLSLISTALYHQVHLGLWLATLGTVLAIGIAIVRLPRTAYGFMFGAALVFAVFNLLNKQSFFNQWEFTANLVLVALVLGYSDVRTTKGEDAIGLEEPKAARVEVPLT